MSRTYVDNAKTKTAILFQEPKARQSKRDVPVPASIMAMIKVHKARQNEEKLLVCAAYDDRGLVFCTPDVRPVDPRNLLRQHRILLTKAGLRLVSFHDLRHTFATMLLEMNEHPKVVQEILGHSKISITTPTLLCLASKKYSKRQK